MERLFSLLKSLDLRPNEFAVFGSGPLIIRNIIAASNDLDIICRGSVWKTVQQLGTMEHLEQYDVTVVTLCDGQISFGTSWGIGDFDIDELIDSAEFIEGLPFVRLQHVVRYKSQRASDKDMLHLKALEDSRYATAALSRSHQ